MSDDAMNELFSGSGSPLAPSAKTPGSAILVALCAAIAAISMFVEWATDQLFDKSRNAWSVPMQFLWDETPASFDEFPVGWGVLLGIVLMLVGVLKPAARGLSVVGAAFVVLWPLWYVQGVRSAIEFYDFDEGVGDLVGNGPWLCAIAGLVGLVSAVLYLRSPRSA